MIIKPDTARDAAFGDYRQGGVYMLATVIIGIILFIIALVIYLEYRNEKKYRQERQKRDRAKHQKKKPEPKISKRSAAEKPAVREPKHTYEPRKTTQQTPKTPVSTQAPVTPKEETKPVQEAPEAAPKKEQPATKLPEGDYPDFNYDRLIEMGLSEEEAHEFIQELIPQIGDQIPLIDEAMKIPDFHKMERLTHSIKGSSTTIGTGGVSDLLVEYNTYLKTGSELPVAEAYQEHLKHYFEKLKKQFPPKA